MNSFSSNNDLERLRALPKAEVHLHLEGCFEPTVIETWALSEGVALPRPREDLLKFSGLADFLGFLDLACGLASTPARLSELARPPAGEDLFCEQRLRHHRQPAPGVV